MPLSDNPASRARQLANLRPVPASARPAQPNRKHGAKAQPSPGRQAQVEREIEGALPVRGDDGAAPAHDLLAVRLLSIAICRLESVSEYVNKHGAFYKGGRLRPAAEHEQKLVERCAKLAAELGLTPASRSRIGVNIAQGLSLAQLMSNADDDPPRPRRTRPRPDDIDATAEEDDAP